MSRRPDKYPTLDPRLPDLYGRVLRAAQTMRAKQQAEVEIGWIMAWARRNAKAMAQASLEDAEPVVKMLA